MATGTYILVDQDFLYKISDQIEELKNLFTSQSPKGASIDADEPMDSADAIRYLKITRRTLYKYRKEGLPSLRKANGKLFFWKRDIDKFLNDQFPNQTTK